MLRRDVFIWRASESSSNSVFKCGYKVQSRRPLLFTHIYIHLALHDRSRIRWTLNTFKTSMYLFMQHDLISAHNSEELCIRPVKPFGVVYFQCFQKIHLISVKRFSLSCAFFVISFEVKKHSVNLWTWILSILIIKMTWKMARWVYNFKLQH